MLSSGAAEEREERELLVRLSRANDCRGFWDIGANYGLFTFSLRAALPGLEIEAFEPDPDYVALLRKTLVLSKEDRVRVHPIALTDKAGTLPFERDLLSGSTGTVVVRPKRPSREGEYALGKGMISVVTSTIDAESPRSGAPDLVKIDVEGAELAVLRGGRATITACMPIILLECTRQQEEVRLLLEELGYEIRDPKDPTVRIDSPGMPFMSLAFNPSRHRLDEAPAGVRSPG